MTSSAKILRDLEECYMCLRDDIPEKGQSDTAWDNKELTKIHNKNDKLRRELNIVTAKAEGERTRVHLKRAKKELKHLQTIAEASQAKLKRAEKSTNKQINKTIAKYTGGGPDDIIDGKMQVTSLEKGKKKILSKRAEKQRARLRRVSDNK